MLRIFAIGAVVTGLGAACAAPEAQMSGKIMKGSAAVSSAASGDATGDGTETSTDSDEKTASDVVSTEIDKSSGSVPKASSPSPVATPVPIPVPNQNDEKVSPPGQISGTYLLCRDITNKGAAATQASVGCALLNKTDNKKVVLPPHQWLAAHLNESGLSGAIVELPFNDVYHVRYDLKSSTGDQMMAYQGKKNFILQVSNANGTLSQETANAPKIIIRWQAFTSGIGAPPSNAPGVGDEQGSNKATKICRASFTVNGSSRMVPGKMQDVADNPLQWCYYLSESISKGDTTITLTGNDVMVFDLGTFADAFQWVSVSRFEVPPLGLVGGKDSRGNPIYICRGQNALNNSGVATKGHFPGGYRPDHATCEFEYLGPKEDTNFDVLVWKSALVRDNSQITP